MLLNRIIEYGRFIWFIAETLERLTPPSGRILSAPELTLDADQSAPPAPKRKMTKLEQAEQSLPKMTENYESKIRYTPIPTDNYPDGSTPQEISKFQLDKSWKLHKVMELVGGKYVMFLKYIHKKVVTKMSL